MLFGYFWYSQSRKWLKLYSCKFQWSQNPIIRSHFSVNSHHKKKVCFGRIRIKRFVGEVRTFPCVPVSTGILSNNPGPEMCQTTERPRDWDLHCQETVWYTAWPPPGIHILKIRDRFRLYNQNTFSIFQSLICTGIHCLKCLKSWWRDVRIKNRSQLLH